jgi:hypothetical protein
MMDFLRKVLALFIAVTLITFGNIGWAATVTAKTDIKHTPDKYYTPGFRIQVKAEIKDDSDVKLARCYFKAKDEISYLFVPMQSVSRAKYAGILPAPWLNSKAIDYFFLVVNSDKKVVKSQVFQIEEKETEEASKWREAEKADEKLDLDEIKKIKKELERYKDKLKDSQQVDKKGNVTVETDAVLAPAIVAGFQDNIVVSAVDASERFGMVAEDIYSEQQIARAGGRSAVSTSTGATSGGTVVAGSAGISATAIVIGGLVAA